MNDKKNPVQSDPKLKSYYCPYCKKTIMKGNIKRVSLAWPHCSEFINVVENDLIKTESNEA